MTWWETVIAVLVVIYALHGIYAFVRDHMWGDEWKRGNPHFEWDEAAQRWRRVR